MRTYRGTASFFINGIKATDREIKEGYYLYATLAKAINHILCNEIANSEYLEYECGDLEAEENCPYAIFQYFIIDDEAADVLRTYSNEILFYESKLGLYVWGVTHYGTPWSSVYTDIALNCGDDLYYKKKEEVENEREVF